MSTSLVNGRSTSWTRGPRRRTKRFVDVVVGTAALLVLCPVALFVAVAVRLTMGSPVIFRQTRPGLHGDPFVLLKFRTMRPPKGPGREAEEDFDLRLTRLGRWLRLSSLDEIPQLINVLRGDVSLVGPRPLLCEYLPLYDTEQARRHDVPPGLTGLAQICGRSTMRMEERFVLDVWYVDHWSLKLDLAILLRTAVYVLRRGGTSPDGVPSEPAWTGNPALPEPRSGRVDDAVSAPADAVPTPRTTPTDRPTERGTTP